MPNALVVEHNTSLAESYMDSLTRAGFYVEAVGNVSHATSIIPRLMPDLVVLDVHLPGGAAMLLMSYIRRFKRLAHTKVVALTNEISLEAGASTRWDADLIIQKPIEPMELAMMAMDVYEAVRAS